MNVSVDQARDDELAAGLNDVGVARSCDFSLLANLADAISFDENRAPRRWWSSGSVNQSPAFNDKGVLKWRGWVSVRRRMKQKPQRTGKEKRAVWIFP